MSYQKKPLQILVIEDNPGDFILFSECLHLTGVPVEMIKHTISLEDGIISLSEILPDIIFLDLSLTDSSGIETFIDLQKNASHVPVVVLSGLADLDIALETISLGAQDYLMKDEYNEKLLKRSIQYSIERKHNQLKLQETYKLYELVSTATNDIVWDWDLNTNDIFWNDVVKTVFGYDKTVLKNDAWCADNIHPQDRQRVEEKLQHHLDNGINHWSDEYRFRCADGTYKFVFDRGYIFIDEKNKPYRVIGSMQDVTDRKNLQDALTKEKMDKQKGLLQATIEGQEKERNEIGKELHDNINQLLASAKLFLDSAMTNESHKDEFMKLSSGILINCIDEIRKLSKNLVAPGNGDLDILESINEMINSLEFTTGLKIKLITAEYLVEEMNYQQKLALYRIIQEQLNNIIKHAKAKNVSITIKETDNIITMIVEDDGQGFDLKDKRKGIGLTNIQNRAELLEGACKIISSKEKGCILIVQLPKAKDQIAA